MTICHRLAASARARRYRAAAARRGWAHQGAHSEPPRRQRLASLCRSAQAVRQRRPDSAHRFSAIPALLRSSCLPPPWRLPHSFPALHASALLGNAGDFILLVYLLALARFFLVLGAMDGGSSFGGMGASREALVSTLAEAPLLLGLVAVAIVAHGASIAAIVRWTSGQPFFHISPVHALAFVAFALVAIAETGRVPVDNPTTHLELTMIHEAMVLEYSGPSLALIEWASAIKLNLMLALLIVAVFVPWGIAADRFFFRDWRSLLAAYVLKMALLAIRWRCWKAASPNSACTWCRIFLAWHARCRFWQWCSLL